MKLVDTKHDHAYTLHWREFKCCYWSRMTMSEWRDLYLLLDGGAQILAISDMSGLDRNPWLALSKMNLRNKMGV